MKNKIIKYIEKLEQEKGIKILLACETGSRAWGFPSPDSDYDIRIIYVHSKDWYLSLLEKKDSIDLMFEDNEIDISGWDLRKSLRLLQKSNPPLLERIQSPIIYKAEEGFINEIRELANSQYSRIATIHHYLSMAKKFMAELKTEENYKLKKFFYALRSTVACKWILEKENNPPIEFGKMLNDLDINKNLKNKIEELISLKATISESYLHKGEPELINFMDDIIKIADEKRKYLPSAKGSIKELDEYFLKVLANNDN